MSIPDGLPTRQAGFCPSCSAIGVRSIGRRRSGLDARIPSLVEKPDPDSIGDAGGMWRGSFNFSERERGGSTSGGMHIFRDLALERLTGEAEKDES